MKEGIFFEEDINKNDLDLAIAFINSHIAIINNMARNLQQPEMPLIKMSSEDVKG